MKFYIVKLFYSTDSKYLAIDMSGNIYLTYNKCHAHKFKSEEKANYSLMAVKYLKRAGFKNYINFKDSNVVIDYYTDKRTYEVKKKGLGNGS